MTDFRYLYLHGFASSRLSTKGVALRDRLRPHGVRLELLELNVPTFETQSYSAVLALLDELDRATPEGTRLRLLGSSMGGYLATRWAELNPDRVAGLFLLCPGFDLAARWPLLLGRKAFEQWRERGKLLVEDAEGRARSLHWAFVQDAHAHPPFPEVRCPVRIVHGTRDDVVPIELSRDYAATRPHVELVEVDDDHRLATSIDRIEGEVRRWFAIGS